MTEDEIKHFFNELHVYKFTGNIHELSSILSSSYTTLFTNDMVYFATLDDSASNLDSRITEI